MKKKLVVWGANAQDEKVLIALELLDEANKVMVYTFPSAMVSDDFYGKMMNDWRDDKETVEFPEGHIELKTDLSMSEGLLPDDLKTDRTDLIQRAQTEWHFIVLSNKLNAAYQQELAELKEKVAALTDFDQPMWDNLKGFWDKVQDQVKERNLFREHADELRNGTNGLFEEMKGLRAKLNKEFEAKSESIYADMSAKIDGIYERIESGNHRFANVFEELKKIQNKYKNAPLTGKHRNSLWDRIDGAFKAAKKERFGSEASGGSLVERLEKRIAGLQSAQKRMEDTVRRDQRDLDYQNERVNSTFGQLEAQIRQAKMSMIEERLASKQEKLDDIKKTYVKVLEQLEKAKEKEAAQAVANEEKKRFAEAKKAAKAAIAEQIVTSTVTPVEENVTEAPTKTVEKVEEIEVEEAMETVAVTETTDEEDDTPGIIESAKDALSDAAESSGLSTVAAILSESFEDVVDSAKAIAKVAAQKAEVAVNEAVKKAHEMADDFIEVKDAAAEKMAETKDAVSEKVEDAVDSASETVANVTETIVVTDEDLSFAEAQKMAQMKDTVVENTTDIAEAAAKKVDDITNAVVDAADDADA